MLYVTNDKKCIFIINYKCCYSTFEHLVKTNQIIRLLRKRKKLKSLSQISSKIRGMKNYKLILITRNPYSRLLSFYFDKFINKIKKGQYNLECQTKMYKYFPLEYIKNGKFTFSNLIEAIKKGYDDKHVRSQSIILGKELLKEFTILKMEEIDFSITLQALIGVENLPHKNKTKKGNITISNGDKKKIYKLYRSDFNNFNYPFEYPEYEE